MSNREDLLVEELRRSLEHEPPTLPRDLLEMREPDIAGVLNRLSMIEAAHTVKHLPLPIATRLCDQPELRRRGMILEQLDPQQSAAGRAESIFDWYEHRGQAENFIKDLKNEVAADRLSCSANRANAFRLQLHALAYNLLVLFRRLALRGTALASATIGTIRLRLLKVGARVCRSVRRLWFHLASGWPGQPLLLDVCDRVTAIPKPG